MTIPSIETPEKPQEDKKKSKKSVTFKTGKEN